MGGRHLCPGRFDPREWRELGQPWTATCFSLSGLGSKLDTSAIIGKVSKCAPRPSTQSPRCPLARRCELRLFGRHWARSRHQDEQGHVHFRAVYGRLSVGKGFFDVLQLLVGAAMYPTCRCGLSCAAGHNAIRTAQIPIGSSHSKCTAQVGSPDPAVQPALCINSCPPFPTSWRSRLVSFYATTGSL